MDKTPGACGPGTNYILGEESVGRVAYSDMPSFSSQPLLLDLLAVIPDGEKAAFFVEDGVLELPFLPTRPATLASAPRGPGGLGRSRRPP
jgi:hypothetical protein